jgi:hypothetical protein
MNRDTLGQRPKDLLARPQREAILSGSGLPKDLQAVQDGFREAWAFVGDWLVGLSPGSRQFGKCGLERATRRVRASGRVASSNDDTSCAARNCTS